MVGQQLQLSSQKGSEQERDLELHESEDPMQKEAWLHSNPWRNWIAAFCAICMFNLLILIHTTT